MAQRAKPRTTPTTALVDGLVDPGSFSPIRTEIRSAELDDPPPGDGVVCGAARVDGRRVYVFAQDPSVLGGSLGRAQAASICRTLDLAERRRHPVIGIHRSGGARIQEGVASLDGYAEIFRRHVRLRQHVPQIALVVGPCAGGAAYGPALMDFLVMPSDGSFLFLTGPGVVREVTGEVVSLEDLGGARVAGRSGLASLVAPDEGATLGRTRRLLSYLPDAIGDPPPAAAEGRAGHADPGPVVPEDPKDTYDVRGVVERILDVDTFCELKATFAPNLVVGFGRLSGQVVGIVANQPRNLAGAIDIAAAQKGAWFVRACERFRIPLAVLVDTPGFLPGTSQELGGVIPAGAEFLSAFAEASVPKSTVVLRKAYGGAYIVMNALGLGADEVFAWPTAEIAVMGPRGAVGLLERRRLEQADDPETLRVGLEGEYRERYCTPWPAARDGFVDEVIEPRETRERLRGSLISCPPHLLQIDRHGPQRPPS